MLSPVTFVSLVALLSVGARNSVQSVLPRRSISSVQPGNPILAAAEVGWSGTVVFPRPIDELLGVDGGDRTLFTSCKRVLRV